jgi:hypothetical protein
VLGDHVEIANLPVQNLYLVTDNRSMNPEFTTISAGLSDDKEMRDAEAPTKPSHDVPMSG